MLSVYWCLSDDSLSGCIQPLLSQAVCVWQCHALSSLQPSKGIPGEAVAFHICLQIISRHVYRKLHVEGCKIDLSFPC